MWNAKEKIQPPISPAGRNGGINGPHEAGDVPSPLSCASRPLRGLRCSPRRPPSRGSSPPPLGGLQPPALRAVPPAESIEKRVASLTATQSHSSTETSQATGFTSHPYV